MAGSLKAPDLIESREILTYRYQNTSREIGEIIIYINERQIRKDVFHEEYFFILFHFVLALLIAAAISSLFHSMVGRHLRRLSEALRNDSESAFQKPLVLERKGKHSDELEDLCAALNLMRFFEDESCGQCTPCREGTGWLDMIVRRLLDGEGRPEDLELLERICDGMIGNTICVLADAAVMPARSFIEKFKDEFVALLPEMEEPEDYVPTTSAAELPH